MGVRFKTRGSWNNTETALERLATTSSFDHILERYGRLGVQYLKDATPKRSYKTAESWYYEIEHSPSGASSLIFKNRNEVKGVNIAIILQYGHGTKNGGYVRGVDYINPASKKAFEQMAKELWAEVTGA